MRLKICFFYFLSFISWLTVTTSCSFANSVSIVEEKKARATIVIAKNSSIQIREAAQLLQHYIKASTNVELAITNSRLSNLSAIHVGVTPYVKSENITIGNLDQDGFLIRTIDSENVVIVGRTDWGTEFGVYDFLERFMGVMWLMPTDLGVDIPQTRNLIIPDISVKENPVFLSRHLSPINIENNTALDKWGRRNRVKKNIEANHNLNKLFDVRDFGKTNSEIYPIINGKRYIPKPNSHDWQPNFNSPVTLQIATKKILSFFEKNPKAPSYSLAMNDSKKFDESRNDLSSRRNRKNILGIESASDEYYAWANQVAEIVNRKYPDKKFGTLAYNNLFEPPTKQIGINSSIIPFITNERLRWANPDFKERDVMLTKKWSAFGNQVGWYDYNYGLCYLLPRVWFDTMQEYLVWGSKNHVRYYIAELYPNWGEGPKAWLLAKLLWNPNQDVDLLLDKWYDRVAGQSASTYLKSYYKLWDQYWTRDIQNSNWYDIERQYLKFTDVGYLLAVPESYISESDRLLDKAYNLADSPIRKKRVDEIREMWKVYKFAIISAKKYNAKYLPTLKLSKDLMNQLNSMKTNPLHRKSIERILMYVAPSKK